MNSKKNKERAYHIHSNALIIPLLSRLSAAFFYIGE